MRRLYLIITLISIAISIHGQVRISYQPTTNQLTKINKINAVTRSSVDKIVLPIFDVLQILKEDSLNQIDVDIPFRFGKGFDTNLSLNKNGSWQNTEEGRVWTMSFHSSGAKSLNFIFNDFYLPEGAELYIVNTDKTVLYGPVTSSCIPEDGFFMTDLIAGEDVSIYLFEPGEHMGQSRLKISKIVHAYRGVSINADGEMRSSDDLLPCHNDVACFSDWASESKAVALVLLANGTSLCSGALIMSADYSFRPYFLSAFHCIDIGDFPGSLTTAEISDAEHWMFKFGYQKGCGSNYISSGITFNGAVFRAGYCDTDFALMELNSNPGNIQYPPTWLGWDRSGNTPLSGTYIHHPLGNPMKISFDTENLSIYNSPINWYDHWGNIFTISPANTHWTTILDNGVVQNGSSGSPLFDQNKRVIGQLHGGLQESCLYNIPKYSGAFHKSWTGGGTNSTRLSNWLDPNNSGVTTINTSSYPYISGNDIICPYDNPHSYHVSGIPENTPVTWTCSNNLTISPSGTSCSVNASTTGTGYASISARINGSTTVLTKNLEIASTSGNPYLSYTSDDRYIYLTIHTPNIYGIRQFIWNATPIGSGGSSQSSTTGPAGDYWSIPKGSYNVECRIVTQCAHLIATTTIGGYRSAVYPNPVDNTLHIDIAEPQETENAATISSQQKVLSSSYELRLFNFQGNLVRNLRVTERQVSIDVSGLPEGNYFLHIIRAGSTEPEVHKVIISH